MKPIRLLSAALAFASALATAAPPATLRQSSFGPPETFHEQRIIVKPKAGKAKAAAMQSLHAKTGAKVLKSFPAFAGIQVLQLPGGKPAAQALAEYRANPNIAYAEPDYRVSINAQPNDPRYLDGSQWALTNNGSAGVLGADIHAPAAWDIRHDAASIIVADIDTGARLTHEDLAANLWINPGETGLDANGHDKATNGIDDDGDGFIDDVHGINAITMDGDPTDDHGHGTHTAGIIGAVGNNGLGISGVAWHVQIMPLKFLAAAGYGYLSDAIICIDYARTHGAKVMNNSWGSAGYSQALADVIAAARAEGILFVAAAGNSGMDTDTLGSEFYPADYTLDNVVTVGASDSFDWRAYFSNFGSGSVGIFAPGMNIVSCGHAGGTNYITMSGTSMAAPVVSGALALLLAQFPTDNYLQIENRLYATVDRVDAFAENCRSAGRLNLARALASTSTRPANDDFTNSYALTAAPQLLGGSTVDATAEAGEPLHAGQPAGPSVWWKWTPSAPGEATLFTTNATFDTVLSVYTGTNLASLTLFTNSDDVSLTNTNSLVYFEPAMGQVYHIAVSGHAGQSGVFQVRNSFVPRPANDNFAAAVAITGSLTTVAGQNFAASPEPGEPAHAGQAAERSVWWKWTAPANRTATITTTGSALDTMLAVYTGTSVSNLTEVASNDNDPAGGTNSAVSFAATAGQTYFIAVDGKAAAMGAIAVNAPPMNDNFADSIALTGQFFNTAGINLFATLETGEPVHAVAGSGQSVWWNWTAPTFMPVAISTAGSDFDTVLAVYTGPDVAHLTLVAANDNDSYGGNTSLVVFNAQPAQKYFIAVGGAGGAAGGVQLSGSTRYLVRSVGAPEGYISQEALSQTWGAGMNNSNTIVGYAYDQTGQDRAFQWTPAGGLTLLASVNSHANAINDAGQICGDMIPPEIGMVMPTIWENSTNRLLGETPGQARAINSSGDCAGVAWVGDGFHAFSWDAGGEHDLGTLPGDDHSQAYGINSAGWIVGYSSSTNGGATPVLWTNGVAQALPLLAGHSYGSAMAVNDHNEITGYSGDGTGPTTAVVWRDGVPTPLSAGSAEGSTIVPLCMNQRGTIGGAAGFSGIFWESGAPRLLYEIMPYSSGWEFFAVTGINEQGNFGGSGYNVMGYAFLMTPIQIPGARSWVGDGLANVWNKVSTNWTLNLAPALYHNDEPVYFGDASTNTVVQLNEVVEPSVVVFDNTSRDYTLTGAGSISGAALVVQNGAGRVTVEGFHDYTGGTFLSAGTFNLLGELSGSTLTVAPGGTLTGSGTNHGALVVNGTLAPAGLRNAGSVTLNGGGTLRLDLSSNGPGVLRVTGGLNLAASSTNLFTVVLTATNLTGFNIDTNYSWPVITTTAGLTNFDAANCFLDTAALTNDFMGGTFTVTNVGTALRLVYTPHPAPVAADLTLTRAMGRPLAIGIGDFSARWSAAAPDMPTLLGVSPTSTNGTTVWADLEFLYYDLSPAVGADSFTYIITDTHPYGPYDTLRTATGTVFINVLPSAPQPQITSLTRSTPGGFALKFTGLPGHYYDAQRSINLVDWIDVANLLAPLNSEMQVDDFFAELGSNQPPAAFYRIILPW